MNNDVDNTEAMNYIMNLVAGDEVRLTDGTPGIVTHPSRGDRLRITITEDSRIIREVYYGGARMDLTGTAFVYDKYGRFIGDEYRCPRIDPSHNVRLDTDARFFTGQINSGVLQR